MPVIKSAANTGSLLTLQGAGAYDAAVHCASVSAARRMLMQHGFRGGAAPEHDGDVNGLPSAPCTPRGEGGMRMAPSTPSPGGMLMSRFE